MNFTNDNIRIINYLSKMYPDTLKNFKIDSHYLVYDGRQIDISKFNLYDIFQNDLLKDGMSNLKPNALFNIIALQEKFMNNNLHNINNYYYTFNEQLIKKLKSIEPVMDNVCIIEKNDNDIHKEYYSVIDSSGKPHLFLNNYKKDLSNIYIEMKSRFRESLSPDNIIKIFEENMQSIQLDGQLEIEESKVSKDFLNKVEYVKKEHEGNKNVRVYGNREHDIVMSNNIYNKIDNNIYTTKRNVYGDIVITKQNQFSNVIFELKNDASKVEEEQQEKNEIQLIKYEEFIELLENGRELTDDEIEKVDLWLSTIGDVKIYEDFLSNEIIDYAQKFDNYIAELEKKKSNNILSEKQEKILNEYYELVDPDFIKDQKEELSQDNTKKEEIEYVRKLTNDINNSNKGSIQLIIILGLILVACISIVYIISSFIK